MKKKIILKSILPGFFWNSLVQFIIDSTLYRAVYLKFLKNALYMALLRQKYYDSNYLYFNLIFQTNSSDIICKNVFINGWTYCIKLKLEKVKLLQKNVSDKENNLPFIDHYLECVLLIL